MRRARRETTSWVNAEPLDLPLPSSQSLDRTIDDGYGNVGQGSAQTTVTILDLLPSGDPAAVEFDEIVRADVASAPVNTLDHPRYEFYHPWDYAADRKGKMLANHVFLLDLKRRAHGGFFEQVSATAPDRARLQTTFAAEFRYLASFAMFLDGLSAPDHFRLFDRVLETAPWNDSLRARIYSQYRHLAASERDPELRRDYRSRAEALSHDSGGGGAPDGNRFLGRVSGRPDTVR